MYIVLTALVTTVITLVAMEAAHGSFDTKVALGVENSADIAVNVPLVALPGNAPSVRVAEGGSWTK